MLEVSSWAKSQFGLSFLISSSKVGELISLVHLRLRMSMEIIGITIGKKGIKSIGRVFMVRDGFLVTIGKQRVLPGLIKNGGMI